VPACVAVELGISQGWCKYLGPHGRFVGMSGFGASAPVNVLLKHFGITVDNVVAQAKSSIASARA
jgi:transketolase